MSADVRSGKTASIVANGVAVCGTQWECGYEGEDLESTCFLDNGVETGTIGIVHATFDLQWHWKIGQSPISGPPGLYPRDDLQLSLGLPTGGGSWVFPVARVISSKMTAPVKGLVGGSTSGRSNGTFTPG